MRSPYNYRIAEFVTSAERHAPSNLLSESLCQKSSLFTMPLQSTFGSALDDSSTQKLPPLHRRRHGRCHVRLHDPHRLRRRRGLEWWRLLHLARQHRSARHSLDLLPFETAMIPSTVSTNWGRVPSGCSFKARANCSCPARTFSASTFPATPPLTHKPASASQIPAQSSSPSH